MMSAYEKLVERFYIAQREIGSLEGKKVLVSLSGGADSSVLLHFLHSLGVQVTALHVNHMLRDTADRDEDFCKGLAAALNVPFYAHRVDVPALAADKKRGFEETARAVRYDAIAQVMDEQNLDLCATGHTANDNLETLIFNLARGSGSSGMAGIHPRRGNIIRPLIYATRDEILTYCAEENIPYTHDETNDSDDYTRNYIRHNIVPHLEKLNPNVAEAAARLSFAVREDSATLETLAAALIESNGSISMEKLRQSEKALAARAFKLAHRAALARFSTDGQLEAQHIEKMWKVVESQLARTQISLPGKIRAVVEGGVMVFVYDERKKDS